MFKIYKICWQFLLANTFFRIHLKTGDFIRKKLRLKLHPHLDIGIVDGPIPSLINQKIRNN